MCAEAEQKLTHYLSALSIYRKATLSAVGLADSPKYHEALELKQKAFKMLAGAREDYWSHVWSNRCRRDGPTSQKSLPTLRRMAARGATPSDGWETQSIRMRSLSSAGESAHTYETRRRQRS
jgi:hypothetical protein